jgi:glycosyltransferase involved in cell wall biosynthesis
MEVNVFAAGDSSRIETWSGFPFFVTQGLLANGVKVNRIDLGPSTLARRIADGSFYRVVSRARRLFTGIDGEFNYSRSGIRDYFARRTILKACRQYPNATMNLFMTYSFSSYGLSPLPYALYCDQTYEEYLRGLNRDTFSNFEKRVFRREESHIDNALRVYSTNQHCVDFIGKRCPRVKPKLLPLGVNLDIEIPDGETLLRRKSGNRRILFIGRGLTSRGVDILVSAFALLIHEDPNYELHLVGIEPKELPALDSSYVRSRIYCYGYLNKSSRKELSRYMALLESARVFVFPARRGPLVFATKEAMFMYTPVITSNFWGIEQEVRDGKNGVIINGLEPREYAQAIAKLCKDESLWRALAIGAHESARNGTWKNVISGMLEDLEIQLRINSVAH